MALGVTLLVVAWGYLVYAAIDFGSSARSGRSEAWWFLAMASTGAVACLFAGLMLITRILRHLGITSPPTSATSATPASTAQGEPAPVRAPGARRASR